eukprot:CAMPEP_0175996808 /NCGR_PEP_ID=MMETSP0108-20121206/55859_1 /TAXON_ID=195067 ORGANISM="Goniomonas pacifica, Strain CCMP1869" /NCGR_SAMPLE_ID=MMETSP0108 /ASSEMBLY_ACC=CAM_ASM_000204 /LENGTH=76 /DNA_ID=CAMNT_0017329015 /DNA_START=43 /DNA_END=273 /DNA_ORIENTATION=+
MARGMLSLTPPPPLCHSLPLALVSGKQPACHNPLSSLDHVRYNARICGKNKPNMNGEVLLVEISRGGDGVECQVML